MEGQVSSTLNVGKVGVRSNAGQIDILTRVAMDSSLSRGVDNRYHC